MVKQNKAEKINPGFKILSFICFSFTSDFMTRRPF